MFDDFLKSDDYYVYVGVARILIFLNYSDLRIRLTEKCKNSTDEDIIDLYKHIIQDEWF